MAAGRILATCGVISSASFLVWCGVLLPEPDVEPVLASDAGPREDSALVALDAGELDPLDPVEDAPPPPPLADGGCVDAALYDTFDELGSTWSTMSSDGGSVGPDSTYVVGPWSLRANLDSQPSGFAYAYRAVCPGAGTLLCSVAIRIDELVSGGDIGILDLRGTAGGRWAVARVLSRELMFLTPGEGEQRVDRTPTALAELATGGFHTIDLALDATTFRMRVDGKDVAALPVPVEGFVLEEIRAGILYNKGARSPGWDVRLDELRCRYQ